jgi:hypothetical protein
MGRASEGFKGSPSYPLAVFRLATAELRSLRLRTIPGLLAMAITVVCGIDMVCEMIQNLRWLER